jgi:hypothetical protein
LFSEDLATTSLRNCRRYLGRVSGRGGGGGGGGAPEEVAVARGKVRHEVADHLETLYLVALACGRVTQGPLDG